jgi:phage shock protein A
MQGGKDKHENPVEIVETRIEKMKHKLDRMLI